MSIEFLEDLKRQWMAMIDAIDDPLVLINSRFEILRQNRAYSERAKLSKLPITEFKGRKCYEVFAGRSEACTHCLVPQLASMKDDRVGWETSELFADRLFNIRLHRLTNVGDGLFVVHYHDVTQEKLLQEQLAQADKLTALGKLSGGVAHEINSPLAGILAFSQMVLKEMDESNPHRADLKEIEDAARRCKVIVENLLGFSRQERADEMVATDFFESARATLRLASALLRKYRIDTIIDFEPDTVKVKGNPGKLGQVFLNLITNAIYVMKEGGTLTVEGKVSDSVASVSISDTGPGIEAPILHKIFDPFFTTKPIGEGTGLGLSICYSIVKQHGGKIEVNSVPGVGATFIVTLPLLPDGGP